MKLLDVKCDNIGKEEAIGVILLKLKQAESLSVFFVNADCLYKSFYDAEYRNILNSADLVLPDGIGLKIAAKIFGETIPENLVGTDFAPALMERLAGHGYKVFFLGGAEGVARKAAENISGRIPEIKIAGAHSGYFMDNGDVINKINMSGADLLFVGMGVPLQEKWISGNRDRLRPKICLGVGAFFDVLSGRIPRAPLWMRRICLEWLWRLLMEPGRLWRRYLVDGVQFFLLVLKQKMKRP